VASALSLALVGTMYVIPAAQTAEAQQGVTQPSKVANDAPVTPAQIDPTKLPKISAAADQQAPPVVPRRTPNGTAGSAGPQTAAPKAPDYDRSNIPGGSGGSGPAAGAGGPAVAAAAESEAAEPGAGAPRTNSAASPGTNIPASSGGVFNGTSESQSGGFIPPDQGLAVGQFHVVELVNSTIQVFNKPNGASLLGPISLQSWFGTPTNFVFDPVGLVRRGAAAASDQDRHYEVALYLNAATKDSRVLVAVSANGSALSSRCVYQFPGRYNDNTADDAFFDFPKVGVTVQTNALGTSRLLIGGNLFRFSNESFVNNTVIEINKQQIDSCQSASFTRWVGFSDANDNSVGFTPVPVTDYDNSGSFGWYVIETRFGSGSGLTVWRNRFGVGFERFFIDTGNYVDPPGARQPGTSSLLDASDDRLQSAVSRYNVVWTIHGTGLGGCGAGNDTAIEQINGIVLPKSSAVPGLARDLLQLGPCDTNQFMGSVSQDGNGNPLWFYNESGSTTTVHLRGNGFHPTQGFGSPFVFAAAPCACSETRGRWGDYSGIALDPFDQQFVWVAGEVLLGNNNWGTRFGKIYHAAPSI